MKKEIYVITSLGTAIFDLPENTVISVDADFPINHRHWQKSKLFDFVEEKLDRLDKHNIIKRNTRWIAQEAQAPIITTVNGNYLNQGNFIVPNYKEVVLEHILKVENPNEIKIEKPNE